MNPQKTCPVRAYIDISKINMLYYSAVISFCIFLGSVSSILLIIGGVIGIIHIIRHKNYRDVPASVMGVQIAFITFIAVELIAAINNPSEIAFNEALENLPFLGLAGLFYMTSLPREKLLNAINIASGASAILAMFYVVIRYGFSSRIEMGTGNANVFALASMILLSLNIAALQSAQGYKQLIFLISSTCAVVLVIMSGSRVMWLAILPVAIWSLFFTWRSNKFIIVSTCTLLIAIGVSFFATQSDNVISQRIENTAIDFKNIFRGDYSGSIGQRFQLYKTGSALVQDKPWLGHGPGNARALIAAETERLYGEALIFTHAHNAILTSLLRSGIVGLLATMALFIVPIVMITRGIVGSGDVIGQMGLYVIGSTFIAYLFSGLTGLMVGHDIHDCLFIAITCYALYLRFGPDEDPSPKPL